MGGMDTLWLLLVLVVVTLGKPTQKDEGGAPVGVDAEAKEGSVEGAEDQRTVGAVDPSLLAHGGEAAVHDAINEALPPDSVLDHQLPLGQDERGASAPGSEAALGNAPPPGSVNPEALAHGEGHHAHQEDGQVPVGSLSPEALAHGEGHHDHQEDGQVAVGSLSPEDLAHGEGHHAHQEDGHVAVGSLSPEDLAHGEGHHAHQEDSHVPVGSLNPEDLAHGEEKAHEGGENKDPASQVPVGSANPEDLVHDEQHVHAEKEKTDAGGVPVGQADPEALVHGQGHVHHGDAEGDKVPIGATNPETLVHGEEHAHAEKKESEGSVPVGSVNPEHLVHGDEHHGDGHHGENVHAKKELFGSVDPETLLHGAEGGHVHHTPKLTQEVEGRVGGGGVRVGKGGLGPGGLDDDLVHRLMHGEEPHEHAQPAGRLSAETLKKLKLDPQVLKHIDLDKLFDTMQKDYQEWEKDKKKDQLNVAHFEITPENLMEDLVDRYHLKEKARVLDPRATDEWEAGSEKGGAPDVNEDSVKHRLEMAANTEALSMLHRHQDYTTAHKRMHEEP